MLRQPAPRSLTHFVAVVFLIFATSFCCRHSLAQEWTRFRGPNGTGLGHAPGLPLKINDKAVRWRVELPGKGHSSPVLWGDHLFLTCSDAAAERFSVVCIQAKNGELLWKKDFPFRPFQKHQFNSFASATPTVDSGQVYVAWNDPGHYWLSALDHNGQTVWHRDFGPFVSQHGCGTSPILCDDRIILGNFQDDPAFVEGPNPDGRTGTSSILALESKTGRTVWETSRRSTVVSYSTPCIYEPAGAARALLCNSQSHGFSALDPLTGKVLWEYPDAFKRRSISSPVIAGDLILGSCGSGAGGNVLTAIHAPSRAGTNQPTLAFSIRKSAPYVPTPIYKGGSVWLWSDAGIVTCLQASDGEIRYQERVGGDYFGSPVLAEGRIFAVSVTGELVEIEASDKFKVLNRFDLNELCRSTPAIALDSLFIRCEQHLWCLGAPKPVP